MTSQAPHLVRTVVAMLSGIPESKIRIVGGDIGGGFGNKVPVYPGYVVRHRRVDRDRRADQVDRVAHREHLDDRLSPATIMVSASWPRTRTATSRRCAFTALADHGAFDSHVSATKLPAGLFSICTGSYAIPKAVLSRRMRCYTNKAPGGVAYRCSLRVTEAVYLIERMIDVLAQKLGLDKAEIRRRNFVKASSSRTRPPSDGRSTAATTSRRWTRCSKAVDYDGLRKEQAEKRAKGELMGIGISTFTEIVGAGPTKVCDILGIGLFDSCDIRVNPTGSAIARLGTMSQGQGHATTYAQIIATELGLSSDEIQIEEGDTDKAPYGAGTWGSRSTPVGGAAAAMAARKIRAKAQKIAAHLLEVGEGDLEWEVDRFKVKGNPSQAKTMKEIAMVGAHKQSAGRHGEGTRRDGILRSSEHDVSVRCLCMRGRHRSLHRRDQGPALLCAGRLRHADQSDDHRRPDPWRPDRSASPSRSGRRSRSTRMAIISATA